MKPTRAVFAFLLLGALFYSSGAQMLATNPDGLEFERKLVRDAPFAATLITEATQMMSDGRVLTKTTASLIYRDKAGRTRRDWLNELPSSGSADAPAPEFSVINDPVAGFRYTLEPRAGVAERTVLGGMSVSTSNAASLTKQPGGNDQVLPTPASSETKDGLRLSAALDSSARKEEFLGLRQIEGLLTKGTRISFSLTAGANTPEPAEIVAERWESPDLQTPVWIKRSNSRSGETTYRLVDIKRGEQPAALFTVPKHYRVRDEAGREILITQKN